MCPKLKFSVQKIILRSGNEQLHVNLDDPDDNKKYEGFEYLRKYGSPFLQISAFIQIVKQRVYIYIRVIIT